MSEPRHINTSGSRAGGASGGRKINRAPAANGRSASGSSSSGGRSVSGGSHAAAPAAAPRSTGKRRKKRMAVWMPLVVVLCIIGAAAGLAVGYVGTVMNIIKPADGATAIAEEVKTAPEYSGDVAGILVCGIDYEAGRTYGSSDDGQTNDGMTDMIMYFQFDVKSGKVNMLQIPRNTLVGKTCTGATGKTYKASNGQINSIMKSNDDGMAALADVFAKNYQLPVDYYATIDMDALKAMVDNFQGIDVYIPQDIENNGSVLKAGYHRLLGDQVEFLVRNRHGDGYSGGDLTRLNMQRYFYAALFKRIRTANLAELVKLVPHIMDYIHTDMPVQTVIALAYKFLSVDSADIMVCQTPMYTGADLYPAGGVNNSVLVADRTDIADLLNTYFRTYTGPVDASALGVFDDWNHGTTASSANVQYMGQLDTQADTAIANGETDLPDASAAS